MTEVSEITGFPEILDGRVKSLHPAIHAGILARRDNEQDLATLDELAIATIDLVCVNLYPFEEARDRGEEDLVEFIDIGGPTLLRAAAKNHQDVIVVTDPEDYDKVLARLKDDSLDLEYRRYLAGKVFRKTSLYDQAIADWLQGEDHLTLDFELQQKLRYGENPHQEAAFYRSPVVSDCSLASAKQLNGKALSYNNIQDANAALELLLEFPDEPCAVGLKHMNPCGVGFGPDIETAWDLAYKSDSMSIFGGIVALNREVTAPLARKLHSIFLEIIIAPSYSDEALKILTTKKKNLRLLELPMHDGSPKEKRRFVSVMDGLLMQSRDTKRVTREECTVMTDVEPMEEDWDDLLRAFTLVKHVKSNAILLYKDNGTVGVGMGQPNRVGAADIAIRQAGDKTKGSVMASDAYFPMPDTVELAIKHGVRAIIQPGGSIRDQDSIDVCNEAGIPMVATHTRHFVH